MRKASLLIAGIAMTFSAQAYEGPMPGDWALDQKACNGRCDSMLNMSDDMRTACHDLCFEVSDCMANHSQNTADMNDCMSNANRKYELRLNGEDVKMASMNSEGDKSVVTDADNFRSGFEEDNQKGFMDND